MAHPSGGERKVYFCTRCGACCCWPGYVHVDEEEVDAMAAFLKMAPRDFTEKYTHLIDTRGGLSLIEKENGHCIFFDKPNRCQVYGARPRQCSGFPNTWKVSRLHEDCNVLTLRYRLWKH